MQKGIRHWAALIGVAGLAACASAPPAPPAFDQGASAASQAGQFIETQQAKHVSGNRRVAVVSCNVLFGTRTGASAQTSAGLFNQNKRIEAKVSRVYLLNGVDDSALQQVTDGVCRNAERELADAGLEVVPRHELANQASFLKMHENGKASGYEWKMGPTAYRVFTPVGMKVIDPRYTGATTQLKGVWSADTIEHHEGRLMSALKASAVHVDVLVDFAAVESNQQKGFLATLGGQDSAKVGGNVSLTVSGRVTMAPLSRLECHEIKAFSRTDCYKRDTGSFLSKAPLVAGDRFYTEVKDVQSTGSKIAEGVANVIGVLAALSGVGGSGTYDYDDLGVFVIPDAYSGLAVKYAGHFLKMAAATAAQ